MAPMPIFDHLGISVADLDRATEQFDPVMTALGYTRARYATCVVWVREGETELLLYLARSDAAHHHGDAGWQHLGLRVSSRAEVERLHEVALGAGWVEVRAPKEYPRFDAHYYASFVEDANGIRLEFMHNAS